MGKRFNPPCKRIIGERRWAADRKEESPPTVKGGLPQGSMPRGMATAQKRYLPGEMR